jgi:DNA polymerase III delta prime subunit
MGFLSESPINQLNLKLLNKELSNRNISHSYLFYGENMKYLLEIALQFAANINCQKNGCMECRICKNTLKVKYPNLHILEPVGNSITMPEVGDFIKSMSLSSIDNEFKIGIIKEADLGRESFDLLLKTLEDPPDENCIFILMAENINSINPTIRSRCQIYNWIFKGNEFANYDERYRNFKLGLEDLLNKIMSDRKNISAALSLSGNVKNFIPEICMDSDSRYKKELEKIKKSGLDEDEIENLTRKAEGKHKRENNKLTNLIIFHVFDIMAACLEDIIAVIAGSSKEALHYAENYNIIKESFKSESINKYAELLKVICENRIYLNQGINFEIALDRVVLGLVQY